MTEIDLSVGGIYALTIMLAAKWMADINPYLAALLAILVAVMLLVFQVIFSWSRIPMDLIDHGFNLRGLLRRKEGQLGKHTAFRLAGVLLSLKNVMVVSRDPSGIQGTCRLDQE